MKSRSSNTTTIPSTPDEKAKSDPAYTPTALFYDIVLSSDNATLFMPNDSVRFSDGATELYLREYFAIFGSVPQIWHTVFSRLIPLKIASWGYLKAGTHLIPIPFVSDHETVERSDNGASTTMTPSQYGIFVSAVVYSQLAVALQDDPNFLALCFINGLDMNKAIDWYRGCMNALWAFAKDDPSWTGVAIQLD